MNSFVIESTTIQPEAGKNIVSMVISASGGNLVSIRIDVVAPKAMTDLIDIQDFVANVACDHLEYLKKNQPET